MTPRFFIIAALAGLAAATLVAFTGTVGFVIVVIACAAVLITGRLYVPYILPRRNHRAMLAELDPDAGPPAGARPVQSDLFDRLQRAAREHDWRALRALLTDDFVLIDGRGRRYDARAYMRTLILMRRAYPDLDATTDAILADPAEPDVLWLRSTAVGHPRSGPAMDVTSWSRLTVADGGRRLRELAAVGVVRVG